MDFSDSSVEAAQNKLHEWKENGKLETNETVMSKIQVAAEVMESNT